MSDTSLGSVVVAQPRCGTGDGVCSPALHLAARYVFFWQVGVAQILVLYFSALERQRISHAMAPQGGQSANHSLHRASETADWCRLLTTRSEWLCVVMSEGFERGTL